MKCQIIVCPRVSPYFIVRDSTIEVEVCEKSPIFRVAETTFFLYMHAERLFAHGLRTAKIAYYRTSAQNYGPRASSVLIELKMR